jgi:copper chaperone CopZ
MSTPTGPRHSTHTETTDPETADPTDTTAGEEVDLESGASPVEPTAGRTPTAAPAAAPWAVLLALVVLALGVVGIRDALIAAGAFGGSSWTRNTANAIDGLTARTWMIPAGIGLAVLGLWWLLTALKPRKRTEISLSGTPGAWMRPGDLARLVQPTVENVEGVVSASTSATRRTVTVKATTTARDSTEVRTAVTDVVGDRLSALRRAPRVKVKARYIGGSQ